MANKKKWVGILVIVLVFGMIVVGCEDTHDNSASIVVKNTSSSTTYYVRNANRTSSTWSSLAPGRQTSYNVFWNDGEIGSITINYQSTGTSATSWTTRTYYLDKSERRTVEIP